MADFETRQHSAKQRHQPALLSPLWLQRVLLWLNREPIPQQEHTGRESSATECTWSSQQSAKWPRARGPQKSRPHRDCRTGPRQGQQDWRGGTQLGAGARRDRAASKYNTSAERGGEKVHQIVQLRDDDSPHWPVGTRTASSSTTGWRIRFCASGCRQGAEHDGLGQRPRSSNRQLANL